MVLGEPYRAANLVVPCAVCAAWTPPLFLLAVWLAGRLGLGSAAPLVAALAVLVWGAAMGTGILGGADIAAGGQRLVAVCMGLSGALAGAFAALYVAQSCLVALVIVPVDTGELARGEVLVVRRVRQAEPGALVLARDKTTGREILARSGRGGRLKPLQLSEEAFLPGRWAIRGRPFFSIGRKHHP